MYSNLVTGRVSCVELTFWLTVTGELSGMFATESEVTGGTAMGLFGVSGTVFPRNASNEKEGSPIGEPDDGGSGCFSVAEVSVAVSWGFSGRVSTKALFSGMWLSLTDGSTSGGSGLVGTGEWLFSGSGIPSETGTSGVDSFFRSGKELSIDCTSGVGLTERWLKNNSAVNKHVPSKRPKKKTVRLSDFVKVGTGKTAD